MPITVTNPSAFSLSELYDVSIVSPQTGQYLRYNSPTQKWQNTYLNSDVYNYLDTSLTSSNGVVLFKSQGTQSIDIGLSISASGDATGIVANSDLSLTLATVNIAPQTDTFSRATINAKGLVTATSPVTQTDITNALTYVPVNSAGDTMTGLLVLSGDPVTSNGAATKQYVDNMASGVTVHAACVTSTTPANNLSSAVYNNGSSGIGATLVATANGALINVGGYTSIAADDRILVKNQADLSQNGIYVVTNLGSLSSSWTLTRASDFDNSPDSEVVAGTTTFVQNGTLNGTQWVMTTSGVITIGSSPIAFTQLSGPNTYTSGTGISIASNSISNTGVLSIVAGSNITVDTSVGNVTISAASNSPTSTLATNVLGGSAGSVPYQTAADTTTMLPAGTSSQVLVSGTTPSWTNTPSLTGTSFTGIPNSALINSSISVTAGTGLGVTASPVPLGGTLTLTNTGVTSIIAGAGITVSGATGAVTVSSTGTATTASTVAVSSDTTTAATVYPTWVTATSGNLPIKNSSAKLTFNPFNGTLYADSFATQGNITFTDFGTRIRGDFSTLSYSFRPSFQSNVVNGNTTVQVLPNGTSTASGFAAFNDSAAINSAYAGLNATDTSVNLVSGIIGTGTYLPLTFATNSIERMRIRTDGNIGIGTANVVSTAAVQVVRDTAMSVVATSYNDVVGNTASLIAQRGRGTPSSPLPILAGDTLGNFIMSGASDATSFINSAAIAGLATENFSPTAAGTAITFSTTDNTSVIRSEKMRIDPKGTLGIKTVPNTNWNPAVSVIELKGNNSIFEGADGYMNVGAGLYQDSAGVLKNTQLGSGATISVRKTPGMVVLSAYLTGTANTPANKGAEFQVQGANCTMVTRTGGLGYSTGAGATVTQTTSKSTSVTLSGPTGQITTSNSALLPGEVAQFTLINSIFGVNDVLLVQIQYASAVGTNYSVQVYPAPGSPLIAIKNESSSTLSDALVLNFAIIRCATS